MPNALSPMGGPPPAPNPQPQDGEQGVGAPGAGAPQQQQAPAPSHQQTVAALRHFSAIETELSSLLKSPDCGRADLKSQIIDHVTRLVANNVMSAGTAVQQLSTVPERPFEQRQWLEKHLQDAVQGANGVLDHHRAAFQGAPAPAPADQGSGPDDHQAVMSSLLQHYQGLGNARQ